MINKNCILDSVQNRKNYLESILDEKIKNLNSVPDGILRGSQHGKEWQYYVRKDGQDKNGTYIKKFNHAFAQRLGQKGYDQKIVNAAQQELKTLINIEKQYSNSVVEDIFPSLPKSHQEIVKPIEIPDEIFIENWIKTEYEGLGFREDAQEQYSDKGERMRSKSELLIANLLNRLNIPYLYEKPLFLDGFGFIYPDFTLLDIVHRQEIYWEHLGLADDKDYMEKSVKKLNSFSKNGIFIGDRLIVTLETVNTPLNMQLVETMIRNKFDLARR